MTEPRRWTIKGYSSVFAEAEQSAIGPPLGDGVEVEVVEATALQEAEGRAEKAERQAQNLAEGIRQTAQAAQRRIEAAERRVEKLLDAIRAHWRAKYAGRPAELEIRPEDRAMYEVSTRIRAALSDPDHPTHREAEGGAIQQDSSVAPDQGGRAE